MKERLGLSRKELKERRELIAAHGEACPFAACDANCHDEISHDCPFIRHWTRLLSYCMLYMGWCRVLHPEMFPADPSMWSREGT
jgi:hypothetical protein